MANKIYLNSTFGYREDTLKNWQTANPVLEKGEISFVRDGYNGKFVKIGDGHTKWNDLLFAPLPKGEKGDKGEKGIDGKDGINGKDGADYVLTEADKKEIAELIDVGGKEWEFIEDITLTEAVMQIDIPASKLQGLKELHISAYIVPTDKTITNQEVTLGISGKAYWTGRANCSMNRLYVVMDITISPRGTPIFDGTLSAYDYSLAGTSYKGLGYFRTADMSNEGFDELGKANIWMRTTTTNLMAAGTRFKVWGR